MEEKPIKFLKIRINGDIMVFFIAILIIGVGFLLRVYRIDFGLPDLLHFDEPFEVHRALRLLNGSFDLGRAGKGGLYYLLSIELAVCYVVLLIAGKVTTPLQFAHFFIANEHSFYLMGRITSACLGTLAIILVYRLCHQRYGRISALSAITLMAFSGLQIENAHFATVDVLLVTVMLFAWAKILMIPGWKNTKAGLYAGVLTGLSIITKLPALLMTGPLCLANLIAWILHPKLRKKILVTFSCSVFLLSVVTFIGEPGYFRTLAHMSQSVSFFFGQKPHVEKTKMPNNDLRHEVQTTSENSFRENTPGENLSHFYFNELKRDIGVPNLIIFFVLFLLVLRCYPVDLVLYSSFLFPYFVTISSTTSHLYFNRYLLPMIPIIIIIVSSGLGLVFNRILKIVSIKVRNLNLAIAMLIVISCFYPAVKNGILETKKFNIDSPRTISKQWIYGNIPENARILMEGSAEHRSQLLVPLENTLENIDRTIDFLEFRDAGKAMYWRIRREYLMSSTDPKFDLKLVQNNEAWPSLESVLQEGIDYIVIDVKVIEQKHRNKITGANASRNRFYEELRTAPSVKIVYQIEGEIEIYKAKKTIEG